MIFVMLLVSCEQKQFENVEQIGFEIIGDVNEMCSVWIVWLVFVVVGEEGCDEQFDGVK